MPDIDPWDETPVAVPRGLLAVLLEAGSRADENGLLGTTCPSDPCPYCTALVDIHEAVYSNDSDASQETTPREAADHAL